MVKEVGYDNTLWEMAQGLYPIAEFRVSEGIFTVKEVLSLMSPSNHSQGNGYENKILHSFLLFFRMRAAKCTEMPQEFSFLLSLSFTINHRAHKSLLLIRYRKTNFT
jgi:hypothetical protein